MFCQRAAAGLLASFMAITAHADRYGLDEVDLGPLPEWVLVIAFVGLLIVHLRHTSRASLESGRQLLQIHRLTLETQQTKAKAAALVRAHADAIEKHAALVKVLESYQNGELTDEEFYEASTRFTRPQSAPNGPPL